MEIELKNGELFSANALVLDQNDREEWLVKFPDGTVENFGLLSVGKLAALEYIYRNSICVFTREIK